MERPLQESADAAAEWRSPHVVEEAVAAAVERSLTAAAGRAVEFGACDEKEFGSSVEPRLERELGLGNVVAQCVYFIRFYYFIALHNNTHF